LIQVGSLCLGVVRQTLPGPLQVTHVAEPVHVQAIDSNEESDLEGSAFDEDLFGPTNATVTA
jgi:hypothetical protein